MHTFGHRKFSSFTLHVIHIEAQLNLIEPVIKYYRVILVKINTKCLCLRAIFH